MKYVSWALSEFYDITDILQGNAKNGVEQILHKYVLKFVLYVEN
jgi:hypothetical protein